MRYFFLFTSRGERRVLIFLSLLLLAALGARICYESSSPEVVATPPDSAFVAEVDSFFASLRPLPSESIGVSYLPKSSAGGRHSSLPEPVLTPFDPNEADSAALVSLGLKPWIARNIVRYRSRGGRFRRPEQLLKIYGIDSAQYVRLADYIRIASDSGELVMGLGVDSGRHLASHDSVSLPISGPLTSADADSARVYHPDGRIRKFESPVVVDINSADTLLLRRIPGIGSGYARLIVGLRERLGGYHSVDQIFELTSLPDSLREAWKPWLVADRSLIRKLRVNSASVSKLRAHPYISFYQAKVIAEVRRRGRITSLRSLAMFDEFSQEDIRRMEPYLSFE